MLAAPPPAPPVVQIGPTRIVVAGRGPRRWSRATRSGFRFATRHGRTVLAQVANRRPAAADRAGHGRSRARRASTCSRRRRCTRRSPSRSGRSASSSTRARGRSWATSCKRSAAACSTPRDRCARRAAHRRGRAAGALDERPVRAPTAGDDPAAGAGVRSACPRGRRPTPAWRSSPTRSPPGRREAFHGFGGRHNAIDQRGNALESFLNQTNLSAPAPAGSAGAARPLHVAERADRRLLRAVLVRRPRARTGSSRCATSSRAGAWPPTGRDAWQVAASAPALDYVVAPGRAPRAIRTLTGLTGRQRVPPRWALRPQLDRLVRFPPQTAPRPTWARCAATSPTSGATACRSAPTGSRPGSSSRAPRCGG